MPLAPGADFRLPSFPKLTGARSDFAKVPNDRSEMIAESKNNWLDPLHSKHVYNPRFCLEECQQMLIMEIGEN